MNSGNINISPGNKVETFLETPVHPVRCHKFVRKNAAKVQQTVRFVIYVAVVFILIHYEFDSF